MQRKRPAHHKSATDIERLTVAAIQKILKPLKNGFKTAAVARLASFLP
ncbi:MULTISPECIES: hypothetical protein [unclassified Halomonas]|nr:MULTISPECIES: hypothetical protein [unclassified Halomonas]